MKIFHIKSPDCTRETERRFADLVSAFAALGISQHVLMNAEDSHTARFSAHYVPAEVQKFSGLFDLRTQQAAQRIADEFKPHIVMIHAPGAGTVAAKIRSDALRLGFTETGAAAPPCDIALSVGYGGGGKKMDYDMLPVPPLVGTAQQQQAPAARAAYDTPEDKPLIGTMIDLDDRYDLAVLLGAIREIPELHFWIIGQGKNKDAFQEKARKQAVHDRVRFIEDDSVWPALLGALDLCVVPRRETGADRLTLEAWSCGVPVLSGMPAGQTPITHGQDGWLTQGRDALKWREALKQLLPDAELRRKLACGGLERYSKAYAPGQVIRTYLQACETALRIKI